MDALTDVLFFFDAILQKHLALKIIGGCREARRSRRSLC